MATAVFNGRAIAESDRYYIVDGSIYFPKSSVDQRYLAKGADRTSFCGWKGEARYSDVVVDGKVAEAAAWYYHDPFELSQYLKGHIAFWNGVTVLI